MNYQDLSHRTASTIPIEVLSTSTQEIKKGQKSKALTSYRSSLGNASHKAQKEGCKNLTFAIDFFMIAARHVFANGSDCPVLVSYQMWFGQKLFKNAKITTKIMKIWLFCEIQSGNAQNQPFPVFLAFFNNYWPKIV